MRMFIVKNCKLKLLSSFNKYFLKLWLKVLRMLLRLIVFFQKVGAI